VGEAIRDQPHKRLLGLSQRRMSRLYKNVQAARARRARENPPLGTARRDVVCVAGAPGLLQPKQNIINRSLLTPMLAL